MAALNDWSMQASNYNWTGTTSSATTTTMNMHPLHYHTPVANLSVAPGRLPASKPEPRVKLSDLAKAGRRFAAATGRIYRAKLGELSREEALALLQAKGIAAIAGGEEPGEEVEEDEWPPPPDPLPPKKVRITRTVPVTGPKGTAQEVGEWHDGDLLMARRMEPGNLGNTIGFKTEPKTGSYVEITLEEALRSLLVRLRTEGDDEIVDKVLAERRAGAGDGPEPAAP